MTARPVLASMALICTALPTLADPTWTVGVGVLAERSDDRDGIGPLAFVQLEWGPWTVTPSSVGLDFLSEGPTTLSLSADLASAPSLVGQDRDDAIEIALAVPRQRLWHRFEVVI